MNSTFHFLFMMLASLFACPAIFGQTATDTRIYTSDIDRFWQAYDSVKKVNDTTLQKQIIQALYMDKATPGLKNFMAVRQHSAERHLKNIQRFPRFWTTVRPRTIKIEGYRQEIEEVMNNFRELYPSFKQPEVYFTIGCLNSGGTTGGGRVLIGAEITAADTSVDASELSTWLQKVFREQGDVVFMVAHESVHVQQRNTSTQMLLARCIKEGSADFIAELVTGKKLSSPYMIYGTANEKELWNKFQGEMSGNDSKDWLYNGSQSANADLGYFMGYVICRSYYANAVNKKDAVREILELNFNNRKDIEEFLLKSKYNGMQ